MIKFVFYLLQDKLFVVFFNMFHQVHRTLAALAQALLELKNNNNRMMNNFKSSKLHEDCRVRKQMIH